MEQKSLTREQAWALLTQYNEGEFHLKHARIMEDVRSHEVAVVVYVGSGREQVEH